jgi:DNA-binding MarR family transcriptional regulator
MAKDVINEIARNCLMTRTRLISRVLTGVYDEQLRPFGINSPQFALLVVIFKLGAATRADIGRFNHQDRSTLTRNLRLMLSGGWVAETQPGPGARGRALRLTRAGKDLLHRVAPAWRTAQTQARLILGANGVVAVRDRANELLKVTSRW